MWTFISVIALKLTAQPQIFLYKTNIIEHRNTCEKYYMLISTILYKFSSRKQATVNTLNLNSIIFFCVTCERNNCLATCTKKFTFFQSTKFLNRVSCSIEIMSVLLVINISKFHVLQGLQKNILLTRLCTLHLSGLKISMSNKAR